MACLCSMSSASWVRVSARVPPASPARITFTVRESNTAARQAMAVESISPADTSSASSPAMVPRRQPAICRATVRSDFESWRPALSSVDRCRIIIIWSAARTRPVVWVSLAATRRHVLVSPPDSAIGGSVAQGEPAVSVDAWRRSPAAGETVSVSRLIAVPRLQLWRRRSARPGPWGPGAERQAPRAVQSAPTRARGRAPR